MPKNLKGLIILAVFLLIVWFSYKRFVKPKV